VFWRSLDLPGGRGVRGAVEVILAERRGEGMIVALDLFQYFPAKYYVGNRAEVRQLRPPNELFWGPHLTRPGDFITAENLRL